MALDEEAKFWKEHIKNNWIFYLICAIAFVGFIIGLLIVLNFQIRTSWVGGYGTWSIGQFSIGTSLLFIIQLFLWELLLVFLPGGCAFGIGWYYWWKKLLTPEERERVKKQEEKQKEFKWQKHGGGAGGGFSFFIGIVFLIMIAAQGNWLTPFNSSLMTLSYLIEVYLWSIFWVVIILVLPIVVIGLIWYLKYSK